MLIVALVSINGNYKTLLDCKGNKSFMTKTLSVNANLTVDQVRQILSSSCDKIDHANAHYDANGSSATHGYDTLNVRRGLELAVKVM